MPDGGFKAMGRDKDSSRRTVQRPDAPSFRCDRCGALVYEGSWPWCRGDAKDHER